VIGRDPRPAARPSSNSLPSRHGPQRSAPKRPQSSSESYAGNTRSHRRPSTQAPRAVDRRAWLARNQLAERAALLRFAPSVADHSFTTTKPKPRRRAHTPMLAVEQLDKGRPSEPACTRRRGSSRGHPGARTAHVYCESPERRYPMDVAGVAIAPLDDLGRDGLQVTQPSTHCGDGSGQTRRLLPMNQGAGANKIVENGQCAAASTFR
jgi:hypothetical protein